MKRLLSLSSFGIILLLSVPVTLRAGAAAASDPSALGMPLAASNDLNRTPGPLPIGINLGTRYEISTTSGGGVSSDSLNGGSVSSLNSPAVNFVDQSASLSGMNSSAGGVPTLNGPSLPVPVPEPSSSWLLLTLAVIPLWKLRGNRKTRAS